MPRALIVALLLAAPAAAQTQEPPLYPPDEATMKQIREKQKVLNDTIAKLPESPFKPDVEVYAKAVEWVTRHEEYWDAKSGEKILAVLAAGQKRAEELKDWVPPKKLDWKESDLPSWRKVLGKPIVCGFRSRIDGSVQPYSVTLPIDYDEKRVDRLDVVLHGRDATLTEVKFITGRETAKPTKESVPYIQLDVYGRGNNAYRWAGETDVLEAVKAEKTYSQLYRDAAYPNRSQLNKPPSIVILRGFSMGGAGTWHIGLHFPFEFSAIGPGAGFTVTKGYVNNLPNLLPDYVEKCLRIYDAADYSENAFHVPVIAYAGDKDPQQAAAMHVQERLNKFAEIPQITFLKGKDLDHKMPPEYMAMAEAEYVRRARKITSWEEPEKNIHFVTYTTKYNSASWIRIVSLEHHYDRTLFEATWNPEKPDVKTKNVREFCLLLPNDLVPKKISIDGQVLEVSLNKASKDRPFEPFSPRFYKQYGKWLDVTYSDPRPKPRHAEKVADYQGPIDDAFMSAFTVVGPTAEGRNVDLDAFLAASRKQFGHVWSKYFRADLPIKQVEQIDLYNPKSNLVLYGDPRSNPYITLLMPRLPIKWTKDELVVNGKKYNPLTHVPVMIYPNPYCPYYYVVLSTGHTFGEKDLQGTNALLYPHLGDWAVIKPKPTAKEPWAYEVVDAGLFDEFWQFEKK
jgi:hypothetical protein